MRAMLKRVSVLLLFACSSFAASPDVSILKNLAWREVGPYRGGRADAVVGIASQRDVYYHGSCGGGVWTRCLGRCCGGVQSAEGAPWRRPPACFADWKTETASEKAGGTRPALVSGCPGLDSAKRSSLPT